MQDKIQEIMGLVDEYAIKVERSVSSGDASVKFLTEEGEAREAIESKLRELVVAGGQEGYTLVPNEPTLAMRRAFDSAVTEYIREDDDKFDDIYVIKSVIAAVHNITNTSD